MAVDTGALKMIMQSAYDPKANRETNIEEEDSPDRFGSVEYLLKAEANNC